MSLDQFIQFNIEIGTAGIARAGFKLPLIISHKANDIAGFTERIRYYTDAASVAADGFAATSPEVLAAAAIFDQAPHPTMIAIGRCEADVTQVYVVGIKSVKGSYKYKLQVDGQGVTSTLVSITSGVSDTNDDIVDDLVTALNAVVGKNYTAAATGTVGSKVVTITGNAANDWFSIAVINTNDLTNKQTQADPTIATDLDAIKLEDTVGFYWLISLYNSNGYVNGVAAWAETNKKTYLVDVVDTDATSTALGNGDTGDVLKGHGYRYTCAMYYPSPVEMFSAAFIGRLAPLNPGKWTAAFKTLIGPPPVVLNGTQRQHLIDRRMGSYTTEGVPVTWDGAVGSTTWLWLDIVVGADFFADDVVKSVMGLLVSRDKVAFTDEDIEDVKAVIRGAIQRSVSDEHEILDPGDPTDPENPPPDIFFPRVKDIDATTRALRKLTGGEIRGRFQGAVQDVDFAAKLVF